MASAGEEGFWTKLAKDLTSLRVCTIVAREIRAGQVPPEPAVMLWDIAHEFGQCLTELQNRDPLAGTDRDILSRIRTSCAEIGRLYAAIDARALSTRIQSAEVVRHYKETVKNQPPGAGLRAIWTGQEGVDRDTFARMELQSERLLKGIDGRRSEQPNLEPWNEEKEGQLHSPPQLLASTWPIVPELLAAPTTRGSRAAAPAAADNGYQGACRTLFQLEPDEVIVLRKIRELGTDMVLMETVIQLDGDVFCRVRQNHQSDMNLQSLHRQMLDAAMSNWRFMVDAIGKFIQVIEQSLIR